MVGVKTIPQFLQLLARLESAKIHYRLERSRYDAILIEVSVPGQRWEIEIMSDGSLEIERFRSDGNILDESVLEELFEKWSDE